jgi:hypothetical protein
MSALPSLASLSLSKQNEVTTEMWPFDTYETNTMDKVEDDEEELPNRNLAEFEKAVKKIVNQPNAIKIIDELMEFCLISTIHDCLPQDWHYAMIQWLGNTQYNTLDEIAKKYIVSKTNNIIAQVFGVKPPSDDYRDRNWSKDPWNGKDNFDLFRKEIFKIDTAFWGSAKAETLDGFFEVPYSLGLAAFDPKNAGYGPVLLISKLETVLAFYMQSVYKWAVRREYCLRNLGDITTEREGDKVRREFSFPEEEQFELDHIFNQKRHDPDNPHGYENFPGIDLVAENTIKLSLYADKEAFEYNHRVFYGRFFTPWGLATEAPMKSVQVWLSRGLIRMDQIKDAKKILQPILDKWFAMHIAFENYAEHHKTGDDSGYPMKIDKPETLDDESVIKYYETCAAAFKPFEEYFTHKEHGQPARALPNRHEQRIQKSEIDTKLFVGHTGIDESFVQTFIAGVPLTFCQFNRRFFDQALMTFNNLRARAHLSHDSLNEFKYDFATTMFLWNDVMGIYTPPPTQV